LKNRPFFHVILLEYRGDRAHRDVSLMKEFVRDVEIKPARSEQLRMLPCGPPRATSRRARSANRCRWRSADNPRQLDLRFPIGAEPDHPQLDRTRGGRADRGEQHDGLKKIRCFPE
jgi:hypothetical protein